MKNMIRVMLGMLFATMGGTAARAAVLTWDADVASGGAQDGSGVWNGTNTNWFDGAANTNWDDVTPDSAVIGAGSGAAGVITNVGTRTIGGITFNAAGSGSYTITGGSLVLSNNPTFTVNADATINPAMSGAAILTKNGTGTLTLASTANTFAGPFVVNQGTVVLATNGANGGGGMYSGGLLHTNVVNAGATVRLTGSFMAGNAAMDFWLLNGGTLDSAPVVADGSGPQQYLATLTFDVAPGVLLSSNGKGVRTGYTSGIGTFTVTSAASGSSITCPQFELVNSGGQTVTFDVADGVSNIDLTVSSTVYDFNTALGGMTVIKNGAGTLLLSGLNTYTGVTRVIAGRVIAGASSTTAGAFGAFNAAATKVTIAEGATVDINGRASGSDFFYGFTIAGSGTSGQGALINNGANGTSGNRQTPNITLSTNATIGGSGDIYMVNAGHGADTMNMGGYTLTKVGANTFFFDNTSVVSGGTIVVNQGGISQFTASFATGTAFSLANSNGVLLTLANKPFSAGSLTGGGAAGGNVNLGSGTLTVGGDNSSPGSFAGAIYGTGGLIKIGAGSQTLSGTNTFTGNVTVNGGVLRSTAGYIGGSTALGQNNTVTVNAGATLDVGGVNGTGNQLGASWRNTISVNGGTLNFSLTGGLPRDGAYMGVINLNGATVTSTTGAGPRWGYNQVSGVINATNTDSSWAAPVWLVYQAGKSMTVNAAANLTMSGPIVDYPGLTGLPFYKTGDGVLTLAGTNTYLGDTTISNGVLALGTGGSINNSAAIITGTNGTFDVSATGFTLGSGRSLQGFGSVTGSFAAAAGAKIIPGATASAGTLTMNGDVALDAGTTNHFDLSNSTTIGGNVNDLLVVNGNFEPSNSVVVVNLLAPLTNGSYRLVSYSGTKNSSFNPAVIGAGSPRQLVSLDEVTTPGAVDLVVSGNVANLTWNSPVGAEWDVGVSTNWFNPVIASNDLFYSSDAVVFDDTPGVTTTIVLSTNVAPSSLVIDSSTNAFTFTGSGKITGLTGLTKNGANAFTLATSATNDFTGPVVINGGSVVVGGTSLQPFGTLAISNNATLAFNRDTAFTLANAIRGPGSVLQKGPGILTLSGANSYTGGTVVSAGELRQPTPGAVGGGTITLGDANTGTNDVAWRFAGSTQPYNAIVVTTNGSGKAILGSYSGGTSTAHNGPLSLNRPVTFSDLTGDRTTFLGPISGNPGTLTMTGTRITFGNATNTFLANIVIPPGSIYQSDSPLALPVTTSITNDGTYRLNNGGTHVMDALSGTGLTYIIAGGIATLSLGNADGSGEFSGRIYNNAATLSLVKNGAGTQILSGTNTYTGTTTINAGTLQVGNGGNSGTLGTGAVVDNATLIFNRSDSFTNTYAINGTGVVVKTGQGTITVNDSIVAHTGGTIVSNGGLMVDGTLASSVYVAPGATLGGTGTITSVISSDGIVAPGASPGTLQAYGYTQSASGSLNMEIASTTNFDVMEIAGSATLGGALNVSLIGTNYAPAVGDTFYIMISGGFGGTTFDTTNLPPLGSNTWVVTYESGAAVVLSVTNGTTPPPAGYDLFASQILNPADRGYANDPDGDGYANLLEYATGGNPTNVDSIARMNGARTNGVLALRFTRNTNAVDATLIVEGSFAATNDAEWGGIATNIAGSWGASPTASETGIGSPVNVTVEDTVSPATNRFLRLRITRP